jgi:purine catabolism regulator
LVKMDITLNDLMTLEPRLTLLRGAVGSYEAPDAFDAIEISWAVSARLTSPHLPVLRGGELLLVPARVALELSEGLPALLREGRARQVSAIVLSRGTLDQARIVAEIKDTPIFEWSDDLVGDTEMTINRRLTECRGALYRIGTEFERQMADLAVNRAGIGALVRSASEAAGLPIAVLDPNGKILTSWPERPLDALCAGPDAQRDEMRREIGREGTLVLGALRPEQRVIARFLVARIVAASEAALRRDEVARPRGPRRVEATQALLAGKDGSSSEQRAAALALGLDPDAVFLVAVSHGENEAGLVRALAPLGAIHPAGGANDLHAALVAANGRAASKSLAQRVAEIKRRWEADHAGDGATLAVSAPAFGVASLPNAAREADFVAKLQSQLALPKRAASFESVDDIGALRLLYQLRDSSELRQFVAEALGTLENRDQRGTLRATLRAFLESGGSQVDASHRLGIHRNTLAYRLRRIGELVGRDVADPGSWLTLHLALWASEMLEVFAKEANDRGNQPIAVPLPHRD